ncbi:TraX protein [compost metagenome]|uniref:TraX family protein n=2 Tax=Pseudomonas TaxID=286 RepID=A0A380T6U4_9PSED|nr:TraX family protein [Pseudomonas wadenswilerensis]MCE5983802.1 conjugal transfer protein TraX [Pseudomonas sp. LF19]SUQ65939.1 TraX family protein [Pseudomonas wadenswilerensis]
MDMSEQRTAPRDSGLDLLKWLAIITMVADHLRFVWPAEHWLFVVGRLAFPWFCLAIAANVARSMPGQVFSAGNVRYVRGLVVFALLSEWPYRWLNGPSPTLNVMPTLALGLLIAWGLHHRTRAAGLLALATAVAATLASGRLMYGVPGVLLPGAFLLAMRYRSVAWLLPALLALAANLTDLWLREHPLHAIALMALGTAFISAPLGLIVVRLKWQGNLWRVGRWGYGFYPLHLALIKLIAGIDYT